MRLITEIFNNNPEVEVIEFLNFDDNTPVGFSCGGRKLKIRDDDFVRKFNEVGIDVSSANEIIEVNTQGCYFIWGYALREDGHKAYIYRLPQTKGR